MVTIIIYKELANLKTSQTPFVITCRFSEYTPEGCKVPMVMVFREEDTKDGRINMHYTDDIGDMCIFISKSEDFCVKASSCRGLNPNSIF